MKILVVSDTHGNTDGFAQAILREKPDALIFLGDKQGDISEMRKRFPELTSYAVAGNSEISPSEPIFRTETIGGRRICMTHGHLYHVKDSAEMLIGTAVSHNADILVFGHTHIPMSDYIDGVYVLNPGTLGYSGMSRCTYALIHISRDRINCEIKEL